MALLLGKLFEKPARGIQNGIQVDHLDAVLAANGDLLGRETPFPVLSLHVVLGAQLPQNRFSIVAVDVRERDIADRIDDGGALIFGQQRRMLRPHVAVRRDVAEQRHVELGGGRPEILDVPPMQRVECAVDHGDAPAVLLQLIEVDDHDLTSSPLSRSSWSAVSKKSTAPSGDAFAHSISSAKPSSSGTRG